MQFRGGSTFVDMSLHLHNSNVAVDHIVMETASTIGIVFSVLACDWSPKLFPKRLLRDVIECP